jgi:hypothetical protein
MHEEKPMILSHIGFSEFGISRFVGDSFLELFSLYGFTVTPRFV